MGDEAGDLLPPGGPGYWFPAVSPVHAGNQKRGGQHVDAATAEAYGALDASAGGAPVGEPSKRNRPADNGPHGGYGLPADGLGPGGMNGADLRSLPAAVLPQRPGERECMHYLRTGFCAYGPTCRYHHPADRQAALYTLEGAGGYPDRPGAPECAYFLKTGHCKFGSTCKFHHPPQLAASLPFDGPEAVLPAVNSLGLPVRPGAEVCTFFLKTASCKFGATCKYDHPEAGAAMALPYALTLPGGAAMLPPLMYSAPPYPPVTAPLPTELIAGLPPASSPPLPLVGQPTPAVWTGLQYVQLPLSPRASTGYEAAYAHALALAYLPAATLPGQPPLPPQPAPVQPAPPPGPVLIGLHNGHGLPRNSHLTPHEMGLPAVSLLPERPGVPECSFYLKTGSCKFGITCRFHHPRDRMSAAAAAGLGSSPLSPLGYPLRPGEPVCSFYAKSGQCKFGATCKYDHPMAAATPTGTRPVADAAQHAHHAAQQAVSIALGPSADSATSGAGRQQSRYGQRPFNSAGAV